MFIKNFITFLSVSFSLLFLIVLSPLVFSFFETTESWTYILDHLLLSSLKNTLLLLVGVLFLSGLLGLTSAWFCSQYNFPGRFFFSRALPLSLAFPGYVMAFIYIGFFDESGELSFFIKKFFPDFSFRHLGGLILVMSLCTFPYIYLIAKSGFETKGKRLLEVCQSLGKGPWSSLFHVMFVSHWPWILGGLSLVSMEVLSDFGTVATFNFSSLAFVIYHSWFDFDSWQVAARLSFFLFLFVFLFYFLQNWKGRKRSFEQQDAFFRSQLISVSGIKKWSMTFWLSVIFLFSFVIPMGQMILWLLESTKEHWVDLKPFAWNSLSFASLSSIIIVTLSFLFAFYKKHHLKNDFLFHFNLMGYVLPGTVLGVCLIVVSKQLILVNFLALLFLGYVLRFLMVGYQPLNGGLQRVPRDWEEMVQNTGFSSLGVFSKLHFPLMKQCLATSFVLVFIEVLKELPLTLLLRPFGWDTLAVKIFEWTSEGEWVRAALPAFLLVSLSLLPSFILGSVADSKKEKL